MSAVAMSSSSSISRRLRFRHLFAPPLGPFLHGIRCFAAWGGTLVPLGSGSYVRSGQSLTTSLFATAKSRKRSSKRSPPVRLPQEGGGRFPFFFLFSGRPGVLGGRRRRGGG